MHPGLRKENNPGKDLCARTLISSTYGQENETWSASILPGKNPRQTIHQANNSPGKKPGRKAQGIKDLEAFTR